MYVQCCDGDGCKDLRYFVVFELLIVLVYDNYVYLEIIDGEELLSFIDQFDCVEVVGIVGVVQVFGDIELFCWVVEVVVFDLCVFVVVVIYLNDVLIYVEEGWFDEVIVVIDEFVVYLCMWVIGEMGFDFFCIELECWVLQCVLFEVYIVFVKKYGIVMQIYDCDVYEVVLEMFVCVGVLECMVFYCFLGDDVMVCICVDVGYYFFFVGNVMFKNVQNLCDVFKVILLDCIFVEMDVLFFIFVLLWGCLNVLYFVLIMVCFMVVEFGIEVDELFVQFVVNIFWVYGLFC